MNLGVVFIGLCALSLVLSLTLSLPSWTNLMGIAFGVIGLVILGRGRGNGGS